MQTKTILVVDDDRQLVDVLARRCQELGLNVVTAFNAWEALLAAGRHQPDLICLDVNMPCGSGVSICELLSEDASLSSVPVIMLTGAATHQTVRRCHELCAYYVEKCPNVWPRLEPLIRELLNLEQPAPTSAQPNEVGPANDGLVDLVFQMLGADPEFLGPSESVDATSAEPQVLQSGPWVLAIDDDDDYSLALKLRLEARGIRVARAFDGMSGYRRAFLEPAHAILLDYEMPNGQGDYVLRRLKESPATRDIPVIMITGRKGGAIERKVRNLGAAAFLNKPIAFETLLEELRRHAPGLKAAVLESGATAPLG